MMIAKRLVCAAMPLLLVGLGACGDNADEITTAQVADYENVEHEMEKALQLGVVQSVTPPKPGERVDLAAVQRAVPYPTSLRTGEFSAYWHVFGPNVALVLFRDRRNSPDSLAWAYRLLGPEGGFSTAGGALQGVSWLVPPNGGGLPSFEPDHLVMVIMAEHASRPLSKEGGAL